MRVHWPFQLCILIVLAFFSEHVQHYLVVAGFSWVVSAALHYLLLFGTALSLCISVFFQNKLGSRLAISASIVWLVIGSVLLLGLSNGSGFIEYQLFSCVFAFLSLLGLVVAWFERNRAPLWRIEKSVWKITAVFLSIAISVGFSLFIRKPYIEDYEKYTPDTFVTGENEAVGMMKELLGSDNPILTQPQVVLAFFTPDCPHCKRVATFIEASKRGRNFLPVCAIIGGSDARVSEFLESTDYSGAYVATTNDSLFFSIVGGSVPRVYLLKNDSIKGIWGGMTFNYPALDGLSNIN